MAWTQLDKGILHFKAVYLGARAAASLDALHAMMTADSRSEMQTSITNRVRYFAFNPPTLGAIEDLAVVFHLLAYETDGASLRGELATCDAIVLSDADAEVVRAAAEGAGRAWESLVVVTEEEGGELAAMRPLVTGMVNAYRAGTLPKGKR